MKWFKRFGGRRSLEVSIPNAEFQTHVKKISQVVGVDSTLPTSDTNGSRIGRQKSESAAVFSPRVGDRNENDIDASLELHSRSIQEWKGRVEGIPMQSAENSVSSTSDSHRAPRNIDANSEPASSLNTIPQHGSWRSGVCEAIFVVGFDANARDALVPAITWVLQTIVKKGDFLVLIGVMDFFRGPLGYRVQVNDKTWLGTNKKFVRDDISLKQSAWSSLPRLKELCEEREVKFVVNVRATARPEVAIVQEAVAWNAAHVVLDKSLNHRRRSYYLKHLSCNVTRMLRKGGVDIISSKSASHSSPTSVIPSRPFSIRQNSDSAESLDPQQSGNSSTSTLSRNVVLVENNNSSSFTSRNNSNNPRSNEDDELFTIDHMPSQHSVNEESEAHHYRAERPSVYSTGYESEDLFSLSDDASPRNSFDFASDPRFAHNWAIAGFLPSRSSLDSGPPLDKRFSSHTTTVTTSRSHQPFLKATITELKLLDGLRDMVNVHLCDVLFPGESLLVGASSSALFLINSQFAASDDSGMLVPYSMIAGPPNSYVAVEGGPARKLSELGSGQSVTVVDSSGRSRSVPVGYTTTLPIKPVMRLEVAGVCEDREQALSLVVHSAKVVCLMNPKAMTDVSVVDLKVGDAVTVCLRS